VKTYNISLKHIIYEYEGKNLVKFLSVSPVTEMLWVNDVKTLIEK